MPTKRKNNKQSNKIKSNQSSSTAKRYLNEHEKKIAYYLEQYDLDHFSDSVSETPIEAAKNFRLSIESFYNELYEQKKHDCLTQHLHENFFGISNFFVKYGKNEELHAFCHFLINKITNTYYDVAFIKIYLELYKSLEMKSPESALSIRNKIIFYFAYHIENYDANDQYSEIVNFFKRCVCAFKDTADAIAAKTKISQDYQTLFLQPCLDGNENLAYKIGDAGRKLYDWDVALFIYFHGVHRNKIECKRGLAFSLITIENLTNISMEIKIKDYFENQIGLVLKNIINNSKLPNPFRSRAIVFLNRDELKKADALKKIGFFLLEAISHPEGDNNLKTQLFLGFYFLGEGNHSTGFEILQYAEKQGNAMATYYVAACYESGCGATLDSKEAFSHYQKAANLGSPQAQLRLAYMYFSSEVTEINGIELNEEKRLMKAKEFCQEAQKNIAMKALEEFPRQKADVEKNLEDLKMKISLALTKFAKPRTLVRSQSFFNSLPGSLKDLAIKHRYIYSAQREYFQGFRDFIKKPENQSALGLLVSHSSQLLHR